ncbi:hypothetical protein HMPREF9473_01723, partial [, partial [Hungatella hathewayi WAL-18680]
EQLYLLDVVKALKLRLSKGAR